MASGAVDKALHAAMKGCRGLKTIDKSLEDEAWEHHDFTHGLNGTKT